ncbi:hypothetical protein KC19_VG059400 [Ceratodon purpureus]|uniref:Uncharacterized protein n=1 Tax=Ceratodon purpureus TaxID=3225 RepID=A0A8T0HMD5_CERPU|nr:hypothetical protein KC19_VG059400 [Ceratodon purpureus]
MAATYLLRGATLPLRQGSSPRQGQDISVCGPSPSTPIPRPKLQLPHFAPPRNSCPRAPSGAQTQSSSQSDCSCGVSDMSQSVDHTERNKRRREQWSYEPAFFKETIASHAERRKPKHCIPTNQQGKIVGLRTKWHGTCRSIAKGLINWDYKSYAKHQGEWHLLCLTVVRELDTLFSYSLTDLDPNYLPKYLDDAIAHDKSTWRQHFYDTGLQHENCPNAAWETWHQHWNSDEGRQKTRYMEEKRALASSTPS